MQRQWSVRLNSLKKFFKIIVFDCELFFSPTDFVKRAAGVVVIPKLTQLEIKINSEQLHMTSLHRLSYEGKCFKIIKRRDDGFSFTLSAKGIGVTMWKSC